MSTNQTTYLKKQAKRNSFSFKQQRMALLKLPKVSRATTSSSKEFQVDATQSK